MPSIHLLFNAINSLVNSFNQLTCLFIQSTHLSFHAINSPVNQFPGIGQISDNLDGDQNFFFNIYDPYHLVKEFPRVGQELFDLEVALELVEFLHLMDGKKCNKSHSTREKNHVKKLDIRVGFLHPPCFEFRLNGLESPISLVFDSNSIQNSFKYSSTQF